MDRRLTSGFLCCAFLLPLLLAAPLPAAQVIVASNALYAVDTESGDVRDLAQLDLFVKDLAIDAAGSSAYAATSDGIVQVDLASGETVRVLGDAPARSVELDESAGHVHGMFTMGVGNAPELRTFSMESGERVSRSTLPATTKGIQWSGSAVIGLEHGARTVHVYDGATEPREVSLPVRSTKKPGGSTLFPEVFAHAASGVMLVPEVGIEAGVWVVRPGQAADWIALGHEAHVRGGAVSEDGRWLYLGALDHVAKIDLVERREVAWVGLDVVHQRVALSSDGAELFLTTPVDGEQGAVTVLSTDSLRQLRRIPTPNASPFVLAVVP